MDFATHPPNGPAGMSSFPDLMNDPAFDDREAGMEDMDTCRICHGEATEEEPLFYPCKCSGSIKFVHQSCLVEWLSHSQKKHCELCKTPFRFTKLYDPNMPQSLPTPLFLQQALIQTLRTLVTWLRFVLVAFVWLGWLPWSMRAIWRALFWLADGRWSAGGTVQQRGAPSVQNGVEQWAANGTAAATTVLSSLTSGASSAASSSATAAPSARAATINFPTGDPLMLTFIKKIIPSLFMPGWTSAGSESGSHVNGPSGSPRPRYPSWLSDVKFLNTLTPYPTINNMIIDTLEGQLITLLVVVAFILLFLIREWVVQQQPMANIAEGEREAALQLIANNRPNDEVQGLRPDPAPLHPHDDIEPEQHALAEEDDDVPDRSANHSPAPSWTDSDDGLPVFDRQTGFQEHEIPRHQFHNDPHTGFGRPEHQIPVPNTPQYSDVSLFQDILARANGDRDEILRIIREEGHEVELNWIVEALTRGPLEQPHAGPATHATGLFQTQPAIADEALATENGNAEAQSQSDQLPTGQEIQIEQPEEAGDDGNSINVPAEHQPPKNLGDRLINWFWGDIAPEHHDDDDLPLEDDEQIMQDPALEDPFVPVLNRPEGPPAEGAAMVGAPADGALDGNDVDAIEGDDFEGIMDLIGMQGPIFGLLQNGVFCALLIAFTVAIGIWLPYLWGKIALVLLANPLELIVGVPMTAVTVVADIVLDTLIGVVGYAMYWLSFIFKVILSPFGALVPALEWMPRNKSITSTSLSLIDKSTVRLNKVIKAFLVFHESDIPMFSVLSHQALKLHQARAMTLFRSVFAVMKFILHDFPLRLMTLGVPGALSFDIDFSQLKNTTIQVQQYVGNFTKLSIFASPGTKVMNASAARAASSVVPVDYDLAVWDTKDRVIAIAMGYLLATMMGFLYLRITGLLAGANRGQRIEGIVAEVLLQAGGVMKVILIIGIEMIIFPLYCGTLLDVALLPLFSNATISSRIAFTIGSPLTSLFVHWFIGTCYMFHFALFVSMCRKILRTGVLYFIRDPDDPTFHPIRDVLERSITTQLRKIGFSALVYGALVIVCLGGVVWGLFYAFNGIFPIHWSASAPMLEFPVDLLFYNFVMPLAIQSVKPSDGLHDLYNWWFHKCAHFLRLSNFFFPERHPEEEGRHVRRSWWGLLSGSKGDWEHPVIGDEDQAAAEKENRDVYFLRDGRYVRAPASDQVRIPKGTQVFLDVTEDNDRVDGLTDLDDGLHGRANPAFTKVYIPPYFRTRIAAFIIFIWMFAATTGVGITVVPLVIGRKITSVCFSSPVPVNDIYAFSCGLSVVGALAYTAYYCQAALRFLRENRGTYLQSPRELGFLIGNLVLDAFRLVYIAIALVVVLPSLFALLTELYILIPAHTFIGDGTDHVVHVVQDWTLGVLYVQMAIKLTLWHPHSWPAAVLNGIFRDGWFKPNVQLATRALILPLALFTAAAVAAPLSLGGVLRWTLFYTRAEAQPDIYRYAYPATMLVVLVAWSVHQALRRVAIWRINIRDDVYLIGERLHNFSEKRARDVGVSRRVITG
ncbi:RING finger membrane protein [Penicillium brasilianum]|uniref:RING-type E3 ubiquitin transferase n=1 Tax=Penicillium brasilianum TaxID=104259 RepID=A0A1S9RTJ5_PENBI|nr:RING finger membrane protein [Penicillium brasilianum]